MDQHIFQWFNDRDPDAMAECIAAYDDDLNDPTECMDTEEYLAAVARGEA